MEQLLICNGETTDNTKDPFPVVDIFPDGIWRALALDYMFYRLVLLLPRALIKLLKTLSRFFALHGEG